MTAAVKRRVTVSKLETVGDNSLKLSIYTSLEQNGSEAAELFALKGKECDLYLAEPGEDVELAKAPPAPKKAGKKSESEATRDEMWAYHQAAKIEEPFQDWYSKQQRVYRQLWFDRRQGL